MVVVLELWATSSLWLQARAGGPARADGVHQRKHREELVGVQGCLEVNVNSCLDQWYCATVTCS